MTALSSSTGEMERDSLDFPRGLGGYVGYFRYTTADPMLSLGTFLVTSTSEKPIELVSGHFSKVSQYICDEKFRPQH